MAINPREEEGNERGSSKGAQREEESVAPLRDCDLIG